MPASDKALRAAFDALRDVVVGAFEALDTQPTPAPDPEPEPEPDRYPADVLNLRGWKLTLPTSTAGKVTEIFQPKLGTYRDRFFGVADSGGVLFRVWHGGDTTQNSKNPRSELREMKPDGSDETEWSCKSGKHSMQVVGQVNRLTKVKPHTVVAQIHGGDDDVTVWRVEGSRLYVTNGDDTHGCLVDPSFTLGKRYTLRFDVSAGKISFTYNGVKLAYTVSSSDTSCFFKAGAYLQSNPTTAPAESTDEYTEVVIHELTVSHS